MAVCKPVEADLKELSNDAANLPPDLSAGWDLF